MKTYIFTSYKIDAFVLYRLQYRMNNWVSIIMFLSRINSKRYIYNLANNYWYIYIFNHKSAVGSFYLFMRINSRLNCSFHLVCIIHIKKYNNISFELRKEKRYNIQIFIKAYKLLNLCHDTCDLFQQCYDTKLQRRLFFCYFLYQKLNYIEIQ